MTNREQYRHMLYRLQLLEFRLGLRPTRPLPPTSWRELHTRAHRLRARIDELQKERSNDHNGT